MLIPINEQYIKDMVEINTAKEVGVYISLMSYYYMKKYNLTEKEIIKSLKNSLKILKSDKED